MNPPSTVRLLLLPRLPLMTVPPVPRPVVIAIWSSSSMHRAGNQRRQLEVVAARQRQRADRLAVDDAGDFAGGPVHRVAADASTVTVSVSAPIDIVKSAVTRPSAMSSKPVFSALRKPWSSAATA